MAERGLTWTGILLRLLAAVALVFATYNPEGYSYYHWALQTPLILDPLRIFIGVVLLIGWTIYLRATLNALGLLGLTLAVAFFAALIWLIIDWGWIPADSLRAVSYISLTILCGVLTTGVSWSHIRRRFTGQVDVDEIDGN